MVNFQKMLKKNPVQDALQALHDIGMKIVPLSAEHEPVMRWTDIYENGWPSFAQIPKQKFINVASCFGYNPAKQAYLNCLDIDSQPVFEALRDMDNPLVKKEGDNRSVLLMAADNTFMVRTRKEYGYHVYWFSSKENPPITAQMCRPGCEFEIKTNKSGGLTTLPPSTHRSDPYFRYQNFGKYTIELDDRFYGVLMSELHVFVRAKPHHSEKPREEQQKQYKGKRTSEEWEAAYAKLQPWELSQQDADTLLEILQPVYESGNRNQLMMGLAGMLYKFNVSQNSAESVMKWLLDELKDGEWQGRMWNLKSTYRRDRLHDPIGGYRMIADINSHASKAVMSLLLKSSKLFDDDESEGEVQMPPV